MGKFKCGNMSAYTTWEVNISTATLIDERLHIPSTRPRGTLGVLWMTVRPGSKLLRRSSLQVTNDHLEFPRSSWWPIINLPSEDVQ